MKNISFLTLSSFAEKLASFALYSLLAHNFGKESLGLYSYYFSIAYTLFLLLDYGGTVFPVKYFTKNPPRKTVPTIILLKILTYIAVSPFIFIFVSDIFFIALFASFFVESILMVARSVYFFRRQLIKISLYTILEKILIIIIALLGTVTAKSLFVFYIAALAAKLFVVIVIIFKERSKFEKPDLYAVIRDVPSIKIFITGAFSYTLYNFFSSIYARIGIIIMKHLSPDSIGDIGIYASYANIIMSSLILPGILFKTYYPSIAKKYSQDQSESLYSEMVSALRISLALSLPIVVFISIFAGEISMILFGSDFVEDKLLLSLMTIIITLRFASKPYFALVASTDYSNFRFWTSIGLFLVSVVFNILLIPLIGIKGLAITAIVIELFLFLTYRVFCEKTVLHRSFYRQDIAVIFQTFLIVFLSLVLAYSSLLIKTATVVSTLLPTLFVFYKERRSLIFRR
jgi:O-antigen/teichoic acid export membrane protein